MSVDKNESEKIRESLGKRYRTKETKNEESGEKKKTYSYILSF